MQGFTLQVLKYICGLKCPYFYGFEGEEVE